MPLFGRRDLFRAGVTAGAAAIIGGSPGSAAGSSSETGALPPPVTGGGPFFLDGRRWWLRITHRVLLECEAATGIDMLAAGPELERPSSQLLRALLWSALRSAGARWSEAEVGRLLPTLRAVKAAHAAVIEAWVGSMPPPRSKQPANGGSPGKALTWPQAWAVARRTLGLASEEWLDMTPRQLHALRAVHLEELQREELLVGILASTTANFGYRSPSRAMRAESFMLHPFEGSGESQGPVTGEAIMAALAPIKHELQSRKGQ